MSPAGNTESLYGVINAGCDAVYLGGRNFGARAYAGNFTDEELKEAIRLCRIFGKKLYLTVNTLVKEAEFSDLYDFLKPLSDLPPDGLIVQDAGVIRFLNREFPSIPIHASTQLSVTGVYAAKLLKEFGVTRIVPARELSLEEILKIRNGAGVEVEVFIHGAMCYSYSGRCLLSSSYGSRSGNRGRCSQPCRLPYRTEKDGYKKERYLLSMKDLYTLELIPELVRAGIDSFKIEGRMKKAEYAAGVTAVYRKYIDRVKEGSFAGIDGEDEELLRTLYVRSALSDGYFHRRNGGEMISKELPGYLGASEETLTKIRENYLKSRPKLPVSAMIRLRSGEPCSLTLTLGEKDKRTIEATVFGERVMEAMNAPLSEEKIREKIEKSGDSCFAVKGFRAEIEGNVFLPVKALNDLRRNALSKLAKEVVKCHTVSM